MRIAFSIIVLMLATQQQTVPMDNLPQSPLEAFAARSTTEVVWSKEIGQLESQKARTRVTALILQDTTSTPSVMRGIRIDLVHTIANPSCDWKYVAWTIMCKHPNASIYIEDVQLEAVSKSLEGGAAQVWPCDQISQYKMVAPDRVETGLIVCGYEFAGSQPGDLAELFRRAFKELRAESR
jgi:hypothetical protein